MSLLDIVKSIENKRTPAKITPQVPALRGMTPLGLPATEAQQERMACAIADANPTFDVVGENLDAVQITLEDFNESHLAEMVPGENAALASNHELRAQLHAAEQTIVALRAQLDRIQTHRPSVQASIQATVEGVIGLRFSGPQGTGTGDRIKSAGGRWAWSQKALKRGYWILPTTTAAHDLVHALQTEGKPCETFAL